MKDLFEWAKFYASKGFSVIPVKPRSKEPSIKWKQYQEALPSPQELDEWFKGKAAEDMGIALILGLSNLLAIDIDKPELWPLFFNESPEELAERTWVSQPSKGYHVFFKYKGKTENIELKGVVELKAKGRYIVAPPSLHPSGVAYHWLTNIEKVEIAQIPSQELKRIVKTIELLKKYWNLIEILGNLWKEGIRHDEALSIAGILRKAGIRKRQATWIIEAVCKITKDEELKDRLRAVSDTYSKPLKEIAGVSKLREILKPRLGEGKTEEIIKQIRDYLTLPKEPDEYSMEELIEDELRKSGQIKIEGPIAFDEEEGIIYTLPLHVQAKNELPAITSKSVITIEIEDISELSKIPQAQLLDREKPQFQFIIRGGVSFHDKKFEGEMKKLLLKVKREGYKNIKVDREVFGEVLYLYPSYVYFSSEIVYYVIACWIAGTYLFPMFSYYPYLIFRGEKGSAKGTNLLILSKTCWNSTSRLTATTEATIFRIIQQSRPTLIIDEYHRIVRSPTYGPIIKAILEAGAERDAKVPRCSEKDPNVIEYFSVGCPKVIASREELEHEDKGITIVMERVEDQKYAKARKELDYDTRFEELRIELVKWALLHCKEVYEAYKGLEPTSKLTGRYFNIWAPVLAICKVIFPDKFEEMLRFAEAQAEGKLATEWENERAVLEALAAHMDDLIPIGEERKQHKVRLKDLVEWSELGHHQPVRSALSNLKLIVKQRKQRDGVYYYLDAKRLEKLLEEKGIKTEEEKSEERSNDSEDVAEEEYDMTKF